MIKLENVEITGWEAAIRGMRNPKNSWAKSDTKWTVGITPGDIIIDVDTEGWETLVIGPNDQKLMKTLASGGPVHAKYRRMINVYVDITAPLYWWKEFDTYKVGTVANSCSTMHKITDQEFTIDNFSVEHLTKDSLECFKKMVEFLEDCRKAYKSTEDKTYWWQIIQFLPTSYNQKRTVMLSYEVLANIHTWRRNHKLDEWHVVCDWIEKLPFSEIITGDNENG